MNLHDISDYDFVAALQVHSVLESAVLEADYALNGVEVAMQSSGHFISDHGLERAHICNWLTKELGIPATFVTCGEIPRANILSAMDIINSNKPEFQRYFPNLDFRRTADTEIDTKGRGKAFKQGVQKLNVILRTCSVFQLEGVRKRKRDKGGRQYDDGPCILVAREPFRTNIPWNILNLPNIL